MRVILFLLLMVCGIDGFSATIVCADCREATVTNAIATASNRDTVSVPAGTCDWTNLVSITKPIALVGAGIGSTIIRSWAQSGNNLIYIAGTANETNWLIGFEFRKGLLTDSFTALIKTDFVDTDARRLRIATNKFLHLRQSVFDIYTTLGVFDHNEVYGDTNGLPAALGYVKGSSWGGTQGVNSSGDGAMAAADNFGTDKFFFLESNFFTNAYGGNVTGIDAQAGGRYVLRSNYIFGFSIESHGLEAQRERSGRAFEIYNNNIGGFGDRNAVTYFRGGAAVIYSNTISGWSTANFALLNNRTKDSLAAPFGGSDGRNPWDSNSVSNPFVTGTASSAGSLTVSDSGKSWTVNQWVGYIVRRTSGKTVTTLTRSGGTVTATSTAHGFSTGNKVSIFGADQQAYNSVYDITVTDADHFTFAIGFTPTSPATGTIKACLGTAFSEITANTSTQLTFGDSIYSGAYTAVFTSGDTYEINKVIHAMDQPGRVMGADLAGADTPTQQFLGTGQTTSPWYEWNNTREGGVNVDFSSTSGTIVAGTHYVNDTAKPSYTAYTYPHPLVSGSAGGGDGGGGGTTNYGGSTISGVTISGGVTIR